MNELLKTKFGKVVAVGLGGGWLVLLGIAALWIANEPEDWLPISAVMLVLVLFYTAIVAGAGAVAYVIKSKS